MALGQAIRRWAQGKKGPHTVPQRKWRRTMGWTLLIVALPLIGLVLLSLSSCRAPQLGLVDGQLRPCPKSPNCVCSHDSDPEHAIEALPIVGDPDSTWARLREVVLELPRTTIVEERSDYLRAECRSLIFRFVDDLEFLLDGDAIQVRSASRAGHSDLGVNRRRVEEIRERLSRP